MATVPLSYHILQILSEGEMTGYALARALCARDIVIEGGDGYLFPILYMMEQQKLVRTIRVKGETASLSYGITAIGDMQLRQAENRRAAAQDLSAEDEVLDRAAPASDISIEALTPDQLPQALTCDLRDRRARARFEEAYRTYIAEARRDGAEDAEILSRLGDFASLRSALSDAVSAFEMRPMISPRVWLFGGIGLLLAGAGVGLYFLWGVFVLECLAILAGVVILVGFFRFARIGMKRRRAYRTLQRVAEECGFTFCREQSILSSVFRMKTTPAITIKTPEKTYLVRFVGVWKRLRVLHFLSPYIYQIASVKGIAVAPTHPSIRFALYFKPKNMSGSLFRLYHTDLAEFDVSCHTLPLYEKRDLPEDGAVQEVLILNPVPMRATYAEGTGHTIVGGETLGGVLFHDTPGFADYLRRLV